MASQGTASYPIGYYEEGKPLDTYWFEDAARTVIGYLKYQADREPVYLNEHSKIEIVFKDGHAIATVTNEES
jgi:hypothetical protein